MTPSGRDFAHLTRPQPGSRRGTRQRPSHSLSPRQVRACLLAVSPAARGARGVSPRLGGKPKQGDKTMPNWTTNIIRAEGVEADIQAFLAHVRTGDEPFDFNTLIPMPALLKHTASGFTTIDGVELKSWYVIDPARTYAPRNPGDPPNERAFTAEEQAALNESATTTGTAGVTPTGARSGTPATRRSITSPRKTAPSRSASTRRGPRRSPCSASWRRCSRRCPSASAGPTRTIRKPSRASPSGRRTP